MLTHFRIWWFIFSKWNYVWVVTKHTTVNNLPLLKLS